MSEIDAAFERAQLLVADAKTRLESIVTEEDAKLQLIVRFLTEVLGWSHSDISAERKNENGYSDYIISHLGKPAFLIEAKRQGAIGIATTATKRSLYKISGPALKPSQDGIRQAASYGAPEGFQLSVVTDGVCWIFFKPYIPGEAYSSKDAITFPTLDAVLDDFAEFYELASKDGHKSAAYKRIFDKVHQNRVYLTRALAPPFGDNDTHPEPKSQIAFDLDRVFAEFFAGLSGDNDPEMLIECFVETKESRVADFALEKLTANVLGNLDPDNTIDTGLYELIEDAISDGQGETVFIVGPPGAGKSTFLDRFFRKTLPKGVRERCVVVNINMLDATGDAKTSWVTDVIIQTLEHELYANGYPTWDDLLGLYYGEYKRRSEGADAQLYKRDKEAFKEKFGQYMEQQVEADREGYLRRLLKDVVENRKRLPIFVVDNTDEFPIEFKQVLFQYFQALRRHVTHCLLLFPVTDRSAWAFSKTDIFNIYASRSYFLPTPSPREVFRKRVDYLKSRLKLSGKKRGEYWLGRGIKLKIEDLEAFASTVEDIFVDQDYIANRIGMLANYNIRKTLSLSRRIVTSAALNIEDLLKSYLVGDKVSLPPDKFMRALLLGDFNFYKRTDGHLVYPIFDVDREIAQSPLINVRLLALLKARHEASGSEEGRYLDISSITQYFDAMGYTEAAVERSLSNLMGAGLIMPYDSSAGNLASAQKVAISFGGLAHLELAVFNTTFFEQMALTALMANPELALTIRSLYLSGEAEPKRLRNVREKFAGYLLAEDRAFAQLPSGEQFNVQAALTADLVKYTDGTTDAVLAQRDAVEQSAQEGVIAAKVNAIVDWFDPKKGYGFATIEELNESAFLHSSVLEKSGFGEVRDGDVLVCDVARSAKGVAVSKVYSAASKDIPVHTAKVIRVFEDRGYGFVYIPELSQDAFFHFSVLGSDAGHIRTGQTIRAQFNEDPRGRGFQLRKLISFQ